MGDNPEMSDADKMRLKRLARLGGTSTPTQTEASGSSQASLDPAPVAPVPVHTPASASSRLLSTPQPAVTPTAGPSIIPKSTPSPSVNIKSSAPTKEAKVTPNLTLGKRPSSATPVSSEPVGPRVVTSRPAAAVPNVQYDQWETNKVGEVFSVTLESDWSLCWLRDLEDELAQEESSGTTLTVSDDGDKLTIVAGLPTGETIFDYLTGCWKRLYAANREFNKFSFSAAERTRWTVSFEKIKALIISYCGMTLEDPTMFPQPQDKPVGPAEFLPLLLAVTSTSDSNGGDPLTASTSAKPVVQTRPGALSGADLLPFLNDLAIGFPSETMSDVITPTLSLFFQEWYKITPTPDILGSDWRRYLGAVALLVQVKSIAALWQSLLGPLTRLGVYPREFPEIWKTYFSNPTERKKEDIEANKSNLRYTLGGLHSSLFNIYNAIVRASPESREGVLDFFALTIRLNEKRAGMRPNFISDLFFLSNAFLHLGLIKTIGTRTRAEKNMSEIEKELKRAEATRPTWAGADIATLHASLHAYDTQLLDPAMVRLNVSFLGFLMTWLVRLVDPKHLHPSTPIS
ncbi:hypothetical protein IAU59_006704 [Kwoniella sp. CBS 9459]